MSFRPRREAATISEQPAAPRLQQNRPQQTTDTRDAAGIRRGKPTLSGC
jgi:hypothetical protein